jgi:hypothetical protein
MALRQIYELEDVPISEIFCCWTVFETPLRVRHRQNVIAVYLQHAGRTKVSTSEVWLNTRGLFFRKVAS